MAYRVCVDGFGEALSAEPGANLLDVLRQSGIAIDAPCGGQGTCHKCRVFVNGEEQLACQYAIQGDAAVAIPEATAKILTEGAFGDLTIDPLAPGYLCAIDIGTTTVVCFLLSPEGDLLATTSMLNPQKPFGADVISRIEQAREGNGSALTDAIRRGLTELIRQACAEAGCSPESIGVLSVVGNPCMQQLFMGMAVDNLAAVPFAPLIRHSAVVPASIYLPVLPHARLLVVPDIAGYVGADTMACVLAAKLYETDDVTLMVDIGTNGEMVLADHGVMVVCSTAAGPALEGANISCGMRGTTGAISAVDENGVQVIGGGTAQGICGSGLIDAVALMLRQGLINKRGRVLTDDHNYRLTDEVQLTQDDIRQLQLAKGAIAAGIQLLCEQREIAVSDIDRCILAGAFGSYLNPQSACAIGLLPAELEGRIVAGGNLAGSGAKMLATDKQLLPLTDSLIESIDFIELAKLPRFQRTFAKHTMFGV